MSGLLLVTNVWGAHLGGNGPHTPIKVEQLIVLKDFDGEVHALNEYTGKGKWLIVMIWASDCHVCHKEVEGYIRWHELNKNRDASVLGISIDGWENKKAAQGFIDRHKVTFPNLIGSVADVAAFYGQLTGSYLSGTPTFLVFTPSGELEAQQVGAVPTKLIDDFIRKHTKARDK